MDKCGMTWSHQARMFQMLICFGQSEIWGGVGTNSNTIFSKMLQGQLRYKISLSPGEGPYFWLDMDANTSQGWCPFSVFFAKWLYFCCKADFWLKSFAARLEGRLQPSCKGSSIFVDKGKKICSRLQSRSHSLLSLFGVTLTLLASVEHLCDTEVIKSVRGVNNS